MHLSIIISRLSNLLFYVQKKEQDLGELDLQKYLLDENLNLSFYGKGEDKIWKQIKKSIGEQKTQQIKKVVTLSESAFPSRWRTAYKHLFLWKQYFQSNQPLLQQIIFRIKNLSGIKHFAVLKIPIYLISDPTSRDKEINAWFSWTPKGSFVVIEIPHGLETPDNLFPVSVLAHEFFHLILRKNKGLISKINKIAEENKKILTKLSEGMPNRIFLEELLISSFIPEGYLSEKCFNTKVITRASMPKDLLRWREFIAFKFYQAAKKYTNDALRIDEKYLKDLIGVIKQSTN